MSEQQAEVLAETPGFTCRRDDDDQCLVSVRFAHDVPSHPDTDAMERRLRLALLALVPDADITDVRYGLRYARESVSPAIQALHRLRRDMTRLSDVDNLDRDDLAETLAVFAREFSCLDEWLCNGGSIPREWARRHPGGDQQAMGQIADEIAAANQPVVAMAG